jgi:hypothetical protein
MGKAGPAPAFPGAATQSTRTAERGAWLTSFTQPGTDLTAETICSIKIEEVYAVSVLYQC